MRILPFTSALVVDNFQDENWSEFFATRYETFAFTHDDDPEVPAENVTVADISVTDADWGDGAFAPDDAGFAGTVVVVVGGADVVSDTVDETAPPPYEFTARTRTR